MKMTRVHIVTKGPKEIKREKKHANTAKKSKQIKAKK